MGTGVLKKMKNGRLENYIWKISAKGFQINAHSYLPPYTYVAREIGFVDLAQPRQPYAALLANPRATAGDRHNACDQTA